MSQRSFEQLVYQVTENYKSYKAALIAAYVDTVSVSYQEYNKFINNERLFWLTSPTAPPSPEQMFFERILSSMKDDCKSFREDLNRYWSLTNLPPDKVVVVQRLKFEQECTFDNAYIETRIEPRSHDLEAYSQKQSSPDLRSLLRTYGIAQSN